MSGHSLRGLALFICAVAATACGGASTHGDEPPPADPVQSVEATQLFQRGLELAQSGDLLRAEQYIGAAVLRGYPEADALPVLIRVCVSASRLRIAIGYAEPYLARNPDDWSLRMVVASLYLGLDDAVKARHELEQVIGEVPDQPEPHYLMAVLLRDEVGDPDGAAEHFRRYLALAPDGTHAAEVTHALERIRIVIPNPLPEPSSDADGSSDEEAAHAQTARAPRSAPEEHDP